MNRITSFLLIILLFTLPLITPSWHNKLFVAVVILFVINRPQLNILRTSENRYYILLLGTFFALDVLGLLYTENFSYGMSRLETELPVLVSAIAFLGLGRLESSDINRLLTAFIAGVVTLNIASLAFISWDLWDPRILQTNLILANNVIVRIHPAFLSMYISISILFLVDQYFPLVGSDRRKLGWVLFALAVLSVFLIWLNSRTGILGFLIASTFFILRKYTGRLRNMAIVGVGAVVLIITLLPFSRTRFITAPLQVLQGKIDPSQVENADVKPIRVRAQILSSSLDILKGPEFFFGYGSGDGKDELQRSFRMNGFPELADADMDTHNEYLAEIHRHGIIGLVLLITILGNLFKASFRQKSPLLGAFIILFSIIAMFENVFSVQKAASFFAIIGPLLLMRARQSDRPKI